MRSFQHSFPQKEVHFSRPYMVLIHVFYCKWFNIHYTTVTLYYGYTILRLHYTLYYGYTIHYTLYTIHYTTVTLYTIHYTLYTIHYTLYTIHYTLYTILRLHYTTVTLYTIHISTLISAERSSFLETIYGLNT
jgi:hypothetical protein